MARTINTILDDLNAGLHELRNVLSPIISLLGGASAPARPAAARGGRRGAARRARSAAPSGSPRKRARRRSAASPKLKALRALQGRYMGAVRHLSASQKAQVKKVRAESGYDAALKLAGQLAKQG